MKYIECPAEWSPEPDEVSVFLAGGISNCEDWQAKMVEMLSDTNVTLINPRRKNYDYRGLCGQD